MPKSNIFHTLLLYTFMTASLHAQSDLKVFAHRGFRGIHPENTIEAMKRAMHHGAILEMDLAVTRDKQLVVSHDPILNRKITLDRYGNEIPKEQKIALYDIDYHELKKYDVGTKPHPNFPDQIRYKAHIPLFTELIDSVERYAAKTRLEKPIYFVETKLKPETDNRNHPVPAEFVELLLTAIFKKGIQDRIIVQSFDPRTLQIIHQKRPNIPLAFLAKKGTTLEQNITWLGFVPAYYAANPADITTSLVEKCRKSGIVVVMGQCDSYQDFLRMKQLGVHALISDYPIEYLKEMK